MTTSGGSELLTEVLPDAVPRSGVSGEQVAVARSPFQLFWRRLRRDRIALTGLVFIAALVVVAIFAPLIVQLVGAPPPNQTTRSLDAWGGPLGPSAEHIFGVDKSGRDVFSRVVYGSRVSLQVAFIATGLAVFLGTILGMFAGYFRGWTDAILSRVMEVMLAFPVLLLALGLGAACSIKPEGCLNGLIKPGLPVVIFVITIAAWAYFARIIRGQVLSLRNKEFVEAARSLGASHTRIIFREILPNLIAPILVYTTLLIPTNILFEAALSFLGVGIQPPTASWGAMLAEAVGIYTTAWWFMLFPGLALLSTVLAFNLLGDGLQDALNPKADN